MKKQKYLNLGTKSLIWLFLTKNAVFGYFWDRIFFKRNYCHIWNQHPWICLKAEYREIMKMPKIETKSALLGYFWARTLIKLLWYLKSAPSNLSFCKISRKKNNISKFGPKCLIWVFLGRNWKHYCHIWNQYLQISLIANICEETKMLKFGTKKSHLAIFNQKCRVRIFLGYLFFF